MLTDIFSSSCVLFSCWWANCQNNDWLKADNGGLETKVHDTERTGRNQPAVNHHGPRVGHGLGFDSPNEPQQTRGVIGHAVVRPAREVKLPDLPDLVSPPLRREEMRVTVLDTQSAAEGGGECGERREDTACRRFPESSPSKANTDTEWIQTCTLWPQWEGVWSKFPAEVEAEVLPTQQHQPQLILHWGWRRCWGLSQLS